MALQCWSACSVWYGVGVEKVNSADPYGPMWKYRFIFPLYKNSFHSLPAHGCPEDWRRHSNWSWPRSRRRTPGWRLSPSWPAWCSKPDKFWSQQKLNSIKCNNLGATLKCIFCIYECYVFVLPNNTDVYLNYWGM